METFETLGVVGKSGTGHCPRREQVAALEKAKEKQAHGEIETYYPGFLVPQDTYYVGYIKGVETHLSQQAESLILTPKSDLPSCMTERMRLRQPICQ